MKTLLKWWGWALYGKPPFQGYTFDVDRYVPITEEDYESVTVLTSPRVVGQRRPRDSSYHNFMLTTTEGNTK
jgi:hypothetical protein